MKYMLFLYLFLRREIKCPCEGLDIPQALGRLDAVSRTGDEHEGHALFIGIPPCRSRRDLLVAGAVDHEKPRVTGQIGVEGAPCRKAVEKALAELKAVAEAGIVLILSVSR